MKELKHFKYWCYKVLPLVYDDSLSYYEVLCKVVTYINNMIDNLKDVGGDVTSLQQAVKEVQNWIDNYGPDYIKKNISNYLAKMIYPYISNSGYIVYYIPDGWDDITFNTTGLDITNSDLANNSHITNYEYGRLVLSMYA